PDSCAQGVEARLLCGEHEGVGLLDRPFDEPGRKGPGVVGRVAADNAARIHDHGLAATDLAIGGTAVWTRRVRARRDDRLERDGFGALVVKELLDRPRQVPLAAADEALLDEPVEDAVGDLTRPLDRAELVVVLDCAQPLDQTASWNGLDGATTNRPVAGVRPEIGLEADAPRHPARAIGEPSSLA